MSFVGGQGGLKPLAVVRSTLEDKVEVLKRSPFLEDGERALVARASARDSGSVEK